MMGKATGKEAGARRVADAMEPHVMRIDKCRENRKLGPDDTDTIDAIGMMKGVLTAYGSQMGTTADTTRPVNARTGDE